MIRARLHGGPYDGATIPAPAALDELLLLDPARVTIDTFYPIDDAGVRYRFRSFLEGSRGRVADYTFIG